MLNYDTEHYKLFADSTVVYDEHYKLHAHSTVVDLTVISVEHCARDDGRENWVDAGD